MNTIIADALFQLHTLCFEKHFKEPLKSVEFSENQVKISLENTWSVMTYKQLREESDKYTS